MDTDRARRVAVLVVAVLLVLSAALVAAQVFTSEPTYIDGEVPVAVDNGPDVVLVADGETEINMADIWGDEELDIETGAGNITIGGDPGVNATINVNEIEGEETVVTGISGGNDWLFLDPDDKQRLDIRGDVDGVQFAAAGIDNGETDLTIDGTNGGTAEIRLYDLPSDESVVLYDPGAGEVLTTADTNSTGVLDTSVDLSSSSQAIQIRSPGSFDEISLSNAIPEGQITELPDELSVDLEAEAYPVNVTFDLEGEEVGSVEATGNGTVSTDVDVEDLGAYNWSATAEDAAGQTETIQASFETPREITIREEHDPQTIVNDSTVTVRFYTADGEIAIERETSNGTLDMEGLPNAQFVAFAESENHYDRRIFLSSIFEQSEMYLLNESEFSLEQDEAVTSRFTYTDLTGQFPRAETTLQIQRAIDLNNNGTSEFRTVAGDFWGAAGEFETTLEHGERYRLFIQNQETGATDMVGAHIPTRDLTYEIRTSGLTQEAANASGVYANAQIDTNESLIEYVYDDPTGETEELNVSIVSQSGNETLREETIPGPLGTYRNTVALNETQLGQNWIVEFDSDRHRAAIPVGSGSVALPVNVPGWIMALLMSMAVTFVGALYGPRTATLGAWAMVLAAAGIAMFGWAFSWPGVVAAILIAIGATFYARVFP